MKVGVPTLCTRAEWGVGMVMVMVMARGCEFAYLCAAGG